MIALAQQVDLSSSQWRVILLGLACILAVALLALALLLITRRRQPQWAGGIGALSCLWSFLAAGSLLRWLADQSHWDSEQDLLIRTGYFDPAGSPAPVLFPWFFWGVLAGVYGLTLLLVFCLPPNPRHI